MRGEMTAADMTVFAKDYPEARLVVEVKPSFSSPRALDEAVRQVARAMWGANCPYGLVFTPTATYVLRDDFRVNGPEAIRVSDVLPTGKLLSRLGMRAGITSEEHLAQFVREWLETLAASYETALPDDAEITKAFFPEIVGAVAEGRVVAEAPLS